MKTFYKNQICYLELSVIDINGKFISGLTINYEIRKCFDDSLTDSGVLDEINNTYTISYTFIILGEYRIKYITPEGYEDGFENINIIDSLEGGLTVEQDAILRRILGLSQENYRIFTPTYDSHDNMLTAIIKIYNSASDCNADINVIVTYQVISTYNINNQMTSYKVTKI